MTKRETNAIIPSNEVEEETAIGVGKIEFSRSLNELDEGVATQL